MSPEAASNAKVSSATPYAGPVVEATTAPFTKISTEAPFHVSSYSSLITSVCVHGGPETVVGSVQKNKLSIYTVPFPTVLN